jgi:tetratricopeptide (TPR) repeat protein
MNKKTAAARKRATANPSTKNRLASMKGSDKSAMSKPKKVSEDPRFTQAVQNYEAGLKAMQTHKYDRAKACFEKVMAGTSPELADRAAVHLNTCNQHLSRPANQFKTPEEQYDYAISLMNMGDYLAARENFEALVGKCPKVDYIWYGLAALNCLMGHFPESITGLNEAIRLNPANRFQARNDSDFKGLADDPRFTELLYPDTSAEVPSDSSNWRF